MTKETERLIHLIGYYLINISIVTKKIKNSSLSVIFYHFTLHYNSLKIFKQYYSETLNETFT